MHVYHSSYPDIDLPKIDLLTLLFEESEWSKSRESTLLHTWASDPSDGITKSVARDLLRQIAYVLRHRFGIGAQGPEKDVVLCMASLSPLYPIVFYGILAAGGVFSGASTASTTMDLERQMKDSGATVLVTSPEYAALVKEVAQSCQLAHTNILLMNPLIWNLLTPSGTPTLSPNTARLDWPRLSPNQTKTTTACLLYSSGTTGLPKGVRLSHSNLIASNICSMAISTCFLASKPKDKPFEYRTLAHLPMAHIAGIMLYSINPVYMGGTAFWMPKYGGVEEFLEAGRRCRITMQFSVPPIWLQVSKSEETRQRGFRDLEVAIAGAAPMGSELAKEVGAKIGCGMTQTWGLTETAGSIAARDWAIRDQTGSVGSILPNTKLRVVDEEGVDVQPGEVGELLIQSPNVMQGYHNNEAATREAFRDGGWYATGDIGRVKDALVYIVDRKKELIKYKGLQVAPAELEDCLVSHEKIQDAAVVGVFSKEFATEVPRAFVVRADETLSEQDVVEFVRRSLASHKQLRGGVEFVESIPKSPSGKILRKELRQKQGSEAKSKL